MRPCVFIHTNEKQRLGALVSQYSMKRNAARPDDFDVRIIWTGDYPLLAEKEGRKYLRRGGEAIWENDDLQSFTPLRFAPPELMDYQGRAVVTDPDVFAVGDVGALLDLDMKGRAIVARASDKKKDGRAGRYTSVMLLDCTKLTHWNFARDFESLFRFERDYGDWIELRCEAEESLGDLDPVWNDFDHLGPETRLLHNTNRGTQPWKTGLPVDFKKTGGGQKKKGMLRNLKQLGKIWKGPGEGDRYRAHPDTKQERFFFGLLRECVDRGVIGEDLLREEVARGHVRADLFPVLEKAEAPAKPAEPLLSRASG